MPGPDLQLTPLEARLLACLAAHDGAPVSRELLLREVWGYGPNTLTRTVDTTIRRLRCKLEPNPASPRFLLTAYGHGYTLVPGLGLDDCHK